MFLTVKDLKKSYGSTSNKVEVLKGINFEVEKGEICPYCGSENTYLLRGNEFLIKEIEVSD